MLERGFASNTVEAYVHDAAMLAAFVRSQPQSISITGLEIGHLRQFLVWMDELELASGSKARIVSGIKSFFSYLLEEGVIDQDPAELLTVSRRQERLPEYLTIEEIERLIGAIDHGTPEGQRNRAIIETLYSCGLRVSELVGLTLSNLYLDVGFIRVIGKGNRERLVPIGSEAIKYMNLYLTHIRPHVSIVKGKEDIVFLNRRGAGLSRVMIFLIIKDLAGKAGIDKNVHPHTFRHSFATHLVLAGADLRAVQEMLGHRRITTTEIYSHLDRSYLRQTLVDCLPRFGRY